MRYERRGKLQCKGKGCKQEWATEMEPCSSALTAPSRCAVTLAKSLSSQNVNNNSRPVRLGQEWEYMCSFRHSSWNTGHTQ